MPLPQRSLRLSLLQATALLALGIPPIVIHMCDFIAAVVPNSMDQDLVCFEIFSGVETIVNAFRARGCASQGFDHDKDPVLFDIELATGFLTAIRNLLRVKLDGIFWLGLPCNSHSFMSTPQHKRSWTNPFGDESFGFVAQGNLIAYRSAILIAIALVRRIGWFLENPGGSRCVCLPVIQQLINHNRLGTMQIRWWMGTFGGWSCKPQIGLGNLPWMTSLPETLTKEIKTVITARQDILQKTMVVKTISKSSGKKQVSGGKDLVSSASYPRLFGSRVVDLHLAWAESRVSGGNLVDLRAIIDAGFCDLGGDWSRANLDGMVTMMKQAHSNGLFEPDPLIPFQVQPCPQVFLNVKAALDAQ